MVPEANLTISDYLNFLRPGRSHLNETACQVSSPGSYAFPRYKREKFCLYGPFRGKIKATYCASRGFGRLKKSPKTLLVTDVLT